MWGAPRIHGELLKLGIEVSQATVSKYMLRNRKPPSQGWKTFLENHASELVSLDFLTVPTRTFRQLTEVCGWNNEPRYLLRVRDGVYGLEFARQARVLGLEEVITAPRSPWQNAYVERVIGSIRRDCLDHVVVISDRQLRRILKEYLSYYNQVRTHLSLHKDAPVPSSAKPPDLGRVTKIRRVGGLHHEYTRRAA